MAKRTVVLKRLIKYVAPPAPKLMIDGRGELGIKPEYSFKRYQS